MGAKGFISKPFISEDLESIVEGIINSHDFSSEYQNIDQHTYHHINS